VDGHKQQIGQTEGLTGEKMSVKNTL